MPTDELANFPLLADLLVDDVVYIRHCLDIERSIATSASSERRTTAVGDTGG